MSKRTRKEIILATVSDLAADFLFYDRKEDDEAEPSDFTAGSASRHASRA